MDNGYGQQLAYGNIRDVIQDVLVVVSRKLELKYLDIRELKKDINDELGLWPKSED